MTQSSSNHAINIDQLRYRWPGSAADNINLASLQAAPGERIFVRGPSGCGKSTLLALVGGIVVANSGTLTVCGQELRTLSAAKRDFWRADHLGFIFQQFNLLPFLSVQDNVMLPCRFSKTRQQRAVELDKSRNKAADRLLAALGLDVSLYADKPVAQLSVGQQQRVAAARALMGSPEVVLADEPTAALDGATRDQFVSLLLQEATRSKATVLFVSHDDALAHNFDRVVDLPSLNNIDSSASA